MAHWKLVSAAAAAIGLSHTALAEDFTLASTDIAEGEALTSAQVFNGFGCTGENISPALSWSNAPEGTQSFAVTAYDPDAPTGSGWWHWVVYDIPASVTALGAGAGTAEGLPEDASHGRNDYGVNAFGGACPPPGREHRYIFTVFALDTDTLGVPDDASSALIGFNLGARALAKDTITAKYSR